MPARARPANPASGPGRQVVAALLLVLMLGAAALVPLQAAPLAEHADLPHASDSPPPVAGGTLDRTLQVDTDAAQRNLELLLETRGDGEPLQLPIARRPMPAAPATAASAGAWPSLVGLQAQPVLRTDDDRSAKTWFIGKLVPFLRAHRLWLLGALGLVAVAAVGVELRRRWQAKSANGWRDVMVQERSPLGSKRRRRSSPSRDA